MITNIFEHVESPYVQTVTDIPTVLNHIKTGLTKEKVCEGRLYQKGDIQYDEIKHQVLTFTPNGSFKKYRCKENLQSLTGLVYLDIDDDTPPEYFHQLAFVQSCWRSFGGKGLSVLVSVSGLTVESFTHSWTYFYDHFKELKVKVDIQTKDLSRQCLISFDPDIYINPEPIPLLIPDPVLTDTPEKYSSTSDFTSPINYISTGSGQGRVKYKTTLDDYQNQDYIVIEEGKDCRNTYLPRKIFTGKRHYWLTSFTSTMIFNNPSITYERLLIELNRVNRDHCLPILSENEVISIVKWTWDRYINDSLKIKTKKKKIWINPGSNLSTKEKRSIIGKESGKIRIQKTINELVEIYKSLQLTNQKITQKLLQSHSKVSIRTIKRHWKDVMEKVSFVDI